MEAKDSSPSLSVNSISRTDHFATPEDLLSHLLTKASGKCVVFLDFDDTIAFKVHPDGTSEGSLMCALSDPMCDFEECLRKVGECTRVISSAMHDILFQIQSIPDRYQLVVVTKREDSDEIQDLFEKEGLKEPVILNQITLFGKESGNSMTVGGVLFEAEANKSVTIDKGAIIGEWIGQNRESIQSAVFLDDIQINVDYVKNYLKEYESTIHRNTHYGTVKDRMWCIDN